MAQYTTVQQIYNDTQKNYLNLLDETNKLLFELLLGEVVGVSLADVLLACRIVTPVYPIVVSKDHFSEQLNVMAPDVFNTILRYSRTVRTPQVVKHVREFGERETTDDDLVKSTDDATTDTSTDNTYFDPTPRYDVEPTRRSQSDIGQRKRTDDIDRKHIEKAHTDVEYDEKSDWEFFEQYSMLRSRFIDSLIQWLSDTITASREWGVYGV